MTSVWHGEEYSSAARHHRAFDDWFLARCPPRATDTVVDIGSGSGEFTLRMAELVPEGNVTGVEPDPSMLEAARRHRHPNLRFIQGWAENLDQVIDGDSVDLVTSRAVLHWIPLEQYPRVFEAAFNVLRPGGWLHSESAAAGNGPVMMSLVDQLVDEFETTRPERFPDPGTVFEIVEAAGFAIPSEGVRSIAQRRRFTNNQMRSFLQTQVTRLLTRDVEADTAGFIVARAKESMEQMRRADGTFDQTFVRLEVLAQRPDEPAFKPASPG